MNTTSERKQRPRRLKSKLTKQPFNAIRPRSLVVGVGPFRYFGSGMPRDGIVWVVEGLSVNSYPLGVTTRG